MPDFTEATIRENCPHCDPNSFALKYPLKETKDFWVVCDVHPLIEGHVLIIPKKHLSCIAEYPDDVYQEFVALFTEFSLFIQKTYGCVSTFEHGKIGQTVFHSHIHLLPFEGVPTQMVPEGENYLLKIDGFEQLKTTFETEGKYLYFSIAEQMWIVDVSIGAPRFFRDRFAVAVGVPQRGNWKEMDADSETMKKAVVEMKALQSKWQLYSL